MTYEEYKNKLQVLKEKHEKIGSMYDDALYEMLSLKDSYISSLEQENNELLETISNQLELIENLQSNIQAISLGR